MTEPLDPLRTSRLLLRLFRPDDLEALLSYYADPQVVRYTPYEPWTRELGEEQLAKRLRRTGLDQPDAALGLAVERDGQVIGDVMAWCTDDTRQRAELGWAFHPQVAGQGYATEAVRALVDLAFGRYGQQRVYAHLDPRNAASARLCERIGMTHEAHLRRDYWGKGEWSDSDVYGLLREEWTSAPVTSA